MLREIVKFTCKHILNAKNKLLEVAICHIHLSSGEQIQEEDAAQECKLANRQSDGSKHRASCYGLSPIIFVHNGISDSDFLVLTEQLTFLARLMAGFTQLSQHYVKTNRIKGINYLFETSEHTLSLMCLRVDYVLKVAQGCSRSSLKWQTSSKHKSLFPCHILTKVDRTSFFPRDW